MGDNLRIHIQYAEMYQACYSKVLPQLVELCGPDLGRKNAEKYSELSAKMYLLQQHKKIDTSRAKAGSTKQGLKPAPDHGIPVDPTKRCLAEAQFGRQCKKAALEGLDTCFVHTKPGEDARVRAWYEKDRARLAAVVPANAERKPSGGNG